MTLPLFEAPREASRVTVPTRAGRLVRLPLLTNSRMKTYRRCARLHQLQYDQDYRAVERALVATCGVRFLPGFKNGEAK